MPIGFWHRLDFLARASTPFLLTLVFGILGVVPWPLPGAAFVAPVPALIAVHYWTVHRPELLPPAAVFSLGLFQDLLGGAPLGLHALVLLVVQGLVFSQRRYLARRPFIVNWWAFMIVAAGAGAFAWVVASLYAGSAIWAKPLVAQYLLNMCTYPILAWIFARVEALLLRPV